MLKGKHLTLAIESSCDETSVAVVANGREILSNIISSQIDIHTLYGGVVPEIASRHHLENINTVVDEALAAAGLDSMEPIDLLGVTYGPGLIGALLVGVATAKAYALATGKPLVGVHHLKSHISANYLEYPELEPPFLAMIVSGGHTELIHVKGYNEFQVLGSTRDDAVGEAYDKVARVLGLGYPGGPKIDKIAKEGNPNSVAFKRVMLEDGSYDFSFSGTKTGVLNYVHNEEQAGRSINPADVAASFQEAVLEPLVTKAMAAAAAYGEDKIVVAGGVAANSRLRELLQQACDQRNIRLYIPRPLLCTDNGAMVGCAAYYQYMEKGADGLSLNAWANLDL